MSKRKKSTGQVFSIIGILYAIWSFLYSFKYFDVSYLNFFVIFIPGLILLSISIAKYFAFIETGISNVFRKILNVISITLIIVLELTLFLILLYNIGNRFSKDDVSQKSEQKEKIINSGCFGYTLSGSIEEYNCSYENVFIPSQIDNVKITKIENGAFKNNMLKSVDIPETIEEIKNGAFETYELKTVIIRGNIKKIGEHVFNTLLPSSNVSIYTTENNLNEIEWDKVFNSSLFCKVDNNMINCNCSISGSNCFVEANLYNLNEKEITKNVPVKIIPYGNVKYGYSIDELLPSFDKITITGYENILNNIDSYDIKVKVDGLSENKKIKLEIPKIVGIKSYSNNLIDVDVKLDDTKEKIIDNVKVDVLNYKGNINDLLIEPSNISIILRGTHKNIDNIDISKIKVSIDLNDFDKKSLEESNIEVNIDTNDVKVMGSSTTTSIKVKLK